MLDIREHDRTQVGGDTSGEAFADGDVERRLELLLDPGGRVGDELVPFLVEQQDRAGVRIEQRANGVEQIVRHVRAAVRERSVGDGLQAVEPVASPSTSQGWQSAGHMVVELAARAAGAADADPYRRAHSTDRDEQRHAVAVRAEVEAARVGVPRSGRRAAARREAERARGRAASPGDRDAIAPAFGNADADGGGAGVDRDAGVAEVAPAPVGCGGGSWASWRAPGTETAPSRIRNPSSAPERSRRTIRSQATAGLACVGVRASAPAAALPGGRARSAGGQPQGPHQAIIVNRVRGCHNWPTDLLWPPFPAGSAPGGVMRPVLERRVSVPGHRATR